MRLIRNCFLDPTGVSWTAHIMFLLWNQVDCKFQNKSGHKDFGWEIVDSNHSIIVYKSRHLMFLLLVVVAAVVASSLSHVRLLATPWAAARQASLSFTISWSLLKLRSSQWSMMPFNHLILCHLLLLMPSIFLSIRGFSNNFYCLDLHDFIWKITRCSFS